MAQTAQPADITAVTALLKDVYTSDHIEGQIDSSSVLWSQLEKSQDYHDSVGNQAVGFVKTGRNVGTSARSLNGGTLGAAGHQQTARWTLDYAANYLQLKILGTTIAKMSTARQAAVRDVDFEVTEGINDLKKELQRQLYSDGTALIAQLAANTSTATLLLQADTTVHAKQNNDAIIKGWLQPGAYVDIGTTASEAAVVADAKIVSLTGSDSAPAVVIDSSVTTTTSHYISKSDNRSGTTSYEMNGLSSLVNDSGTFAGINSSTAPTWKSNVVDAGGNTLTRAYLQQAWRNIAQTSGPPNLIITSLEQQEAYYNQLQAQVRFASDANLASGKVDGPVFNNLPVVADPDCPRDRVYLLNTNNLFMVSAGDIAWQNTTDTGSILSWIHDEDAFGARAAFYGNLGTNKRRAHAVIRNLAV